MNGQEEAIKKGKGPCVILAGAGTGKTYNIVEKIKYLISNKTYNPERIVCITFSNEAANNLMSRVQRMLSFEHGKEPVIKTFHAFSADLLRKYGDEIGIKKEFNILTPDEAKVVLYRYLKVPVGNCHKYINTIGNAKDLGISLDNLKDYLEKKLKSFENVDLEKRLESLHFALQTLYLRNDKRGKRDIANEAEKINKLLLLKKFVNVWGAYEKIKTTKSYQDYSDLNMNALKLLKDNSEIAKYYDYIIVDEFQDTNKIQLDLLFYLAPHQNITVVGDLNQSIYRFRGAYNRNFHDFREMFHVNEEDIFNLDKSYRSSNKILRAAHHLILHNYSDPKKCFQVLNYNNIEGDKIEVYETKNVREEARKVLELIDLEMKKGIESREICVMFRTHQQGRIIKRALEVRNIPYVSVSKSSLLKEKSIRTVTDYLSILHKLEKNERGGEDVWWDLVYQLGFPEEDLIKIGRFIKDNKENEKFSALMLNSITELDLSDSGKIVAQVLVKKIELLRQVVNKKVPELLMEVYRLGGLINHQKTKEGKAIMLNLNKLRELADEHSSLYGGDLEGFIYHLDILNSLGIEIYAADFESDGVRLMTLHATKGLEYKTVIITNFCQRRFPIEKATSNSLLPLELYPEFRNKNLSERDIDYYLYEYERQSQLFEERRLCYVAFTRAKERLILTYAHEYGGRKYYPSQFLHEVKYKGNADFTFFVDLDEKAEDFGSEIKPAEDFISILGKENFESAIINAVKNAGNNKINNVDDLVLSPSALLLFSECQKKYEYKYIYNMPEQKTISWEALMLGSFVHSILEIGVKKNFSDLKSFEDLAKEIHMDEKWQSIDLDDALHLIRVFFERNKMKYSNYSKTEQKLNIELGGIKFVGFADRIDFFSDGIEIIDYKTGKSSIAPRVRNWQLGYYALAASPLGRVRKITLEMLRHEVPLEFELDEKGNAVSVNSSRMEGFNVYEIEQELIKTAHNILEAYQKGFRACPVEGNCEFCNEYVWRL